MKGNTMATARTLRQNSNRIMRHIPTGTLLRCISAEDDEPGVLHWFSEHVDPDRGFWAAAEDVELTDATL